MFDFFVITSSEGMLTWHDGLIPENEVWLKIGGDKGGNSFKMNFQIANVLHPNSLVNTVVFACFEGTDSLANLQRTLPPILEQIALLSTLRWR